PDPRPKPNPRRGPRPPRGGGPPEPGSNARGGPRRPRGPPCPRGPPLPRPAPPRGPSGLAGLDDPPSGRSAAPGVRPARLSRFGRPARSSGSGRSATRHLELATPALTISRVLDRDPELGELVPKAVGGGPIT